MEQYPEVETTDQGAPRTPHQRGTIAHFNYEGGPLQAAPSRGKLIAILVKLTMITDRPPEGGELSVVERRLRTALSGVTSGMRSENLKVCLRGATREKE